MTTVENRLIVDLFDLETPLPSAHNHITIISRRWFTAGSVCIGIVRAHDSIENTDKYYIGSAHGVSETDDMQYICSHGTKLAVVPT